MAGLPKRWALFIGLSLWIIVIPWKSTLATDTRETYPWILLSAEPQSTESLSTEPQSTEPQSTADGTIPKVKKASHTGKLILEFEPMSKNDIKVRIRELRSLLGLKNRNFRRLDALPGRVIVDLAQTDETLIASASKAN